MILILSIVTLGVYYVIYHFQVNSELRRMREWRDDDLYKPSLFFFMYLALTILWLLSFVLGVTTAIKEIVRELSLESALFDSDWSKIETFSQLYGMFVSFVGIPVTFYFMKLNQYAAEKVGAPKKSMSAAMISYLIYSLLQLLFGALSVMAYLSPDKLLVSGLETLSGDELRSALLLLGGMGLFLFISVTAGLVYLWKQTELVNHVWLAGKFDGPATPASPDSPAQRAPADPAF